MHVSFILYGDRRCVDTMLRDMEAQKHKMLMWKGKKKKSVWIPGQIRELPFGIKEYVFPKESLDMVLQTFDAIKTDERTGYGIRYKDFAYPMIRKFLRLKKVPKYDNTDTFLWNKSFVSIIVLGIREDGEVVGEYIDDKGWTHEAL